MRQNTSLRALTTVAAVCLAAAGISPATASASEIGATHVVFEKPVKMKKADTVFYLPLVDQSRKSDNPRASRLIDCRAIAEASRGPLPVTGKFRLRLIGKENGSDAVWTSPAATASLDGDGRARFQPGALADLVSLADSAGAVARLMQIEFDGGKGKKVARLTIDCENREGES